MPVVGGSASTPSLSSSPGHTPLLDPAATRSDSPLRDVAADRALESAIKEGAAARLHLRPARSLSSCFSVRPSHGEGLLTVLFLSATALASLCIGLIFGWGPFARILQDEGVGNASCDQREPTPCESQTVIFSFVYALASSTLGFGGLPAGLFLDHFGPSNAALLAGGLITAGNLLLAWLPSTAPAASFASPFVLMALGGILTALTAFKSAAVIPAATAALLTSVNVFFDISATIPLLPYTLYFSFGMSRASIFTPYALYVALLYGAWAVLWRRYDGRLHTSPSAADGPDSKPELAHSPATARPPAPTEAITPMDDPSLSVRDVLPSKQFVCGALWFVLHQFRANLYLGIAPDMLRFLGDADGRYMEALTLTLVAAVPFIPLIAWGCDRLGIAGSMQVVTLLAVVHSVCALVPVLPFQLVTFVVFTLMRAAIFSVGSLYVARVFGFRHFGTLYGLFQCIGALLNVLIPTLTACVLKYFEGDWAPVLRALLAVCVVQFGIVSWVVRECATVTEANVRA